MKILVIERALTEDNVVADHIKRLSQDHEVYVLSVDQEHLKPFESPNWMRIRYFSFPKIEYLKLFFFQNSGRKAITKYFPSISFDLVHSFFSYPAGYLARVLAKQWHIPYVITTRGSDLLLYPQQSHFLKNTIESVMTDANAVIGVSQNLCQKAIALGANQSNVFHIPDGVNTDVFNNSFPVEAKENNLLFAGALIPVKNIFCLLDAFLLFSKKHQYKLLIAGQGPLEAQIKSYLAKNELFAQVELLGYLPPEQLAITMAKAKALVLPSLSEGWPNVINEALAVGTPVVASKVGGIPELVDENCGYLFEANSSGNLLEKLELVIHRQWDYELIQKKGLLYTRKDAAKKISEIYQRCLQ